MPVQCWRIRDSDYENINHVTNGIILIITKLNILIENDI